MTPVKTTSGSGRVRLGELLVKAGVITDVQLKTALQEQKQWGGKLGDILVRLKYVSEDIFVRALSKQLGLSRADLNAEIPLEALAKIPSEVAEEYEIVPVSLLDDGKTLAIATADPLNLTVVDYVRSITKLRVVPQVASATAIRAAIAKLYQTDADREQLQIVNNAEDSAFGHSGGPAPRSGLDLAPRNGTTTNPGFRTATNPNLTPLPRPGVLPPVAVPSAYTTNPGLAPVAMPAAQPGMAAGYPYPVAAMPAGQPAMHPQAQAYAQQAYAQQVQPQQALVQQPVAVEDQQRREAIALKALVELLVQKGVITLDEYLARLKR